MKVTFEFEIDLEKDKHIIKSLAKSEVLELKGSQDTLKEVNIYGNTRQNTIIGIILRKVHDLTKSLS